MQKASVVNRILIALLLFVTLTGTSYILGDFYFGGNEVEASKTETDKLTIPVSTVPRFVPDTLDQDKLERLVNLERIDAGLDPLAHSETLRQSACAKLDHMVANNYWAHDAPDGTQPWYFFHQVGYEYNQAGENLAYNNYSNAHMVYSWMQSPAHRVNIMGDYAESGLCTKEVVSFQGKKTNVTVHHFANPK
jgi:uncharacterized protein YkwD